MKRKLMLLPLLTLILSGCEAINDSSTPTTSSTTSSSLSTSTETSSEENSSEDSSIEVSTTEDSTVSSSSEDSSISVEDSSSSEPEPVVNPVVEALAVARGNISFSGTSVKTRSYNNPYFSLNNFSYEYTDVISFGEEYRYRDFTRTSDSGEEYSEKSTVRKDEDGFACTEYLTYKNEMGITPIYDSYGSKVSFEAVYGNPFDILEVADFINNEDGTYTVSGDKADIFISRLTEDPFFGDVVFTISEGVFTKVEAEGLVGSGYLRGTSGITSYDSTCGFTYDITASLSNSPFVIGSNENAELQAMFAKMQNGFRFNLLQDNQVSTSVYFDGTNVLFQFLAPDATTPTYFDFYFTPGTDGLLDCYYADMDDDGNVIFVANDPAYTEMYDTEISYSEMASDIGNTSAAVFVQQQDGTYVPERSALTNIGENIIPYIFDAIGIISYDDFRMACTGLTVTVVDEDTLNFAYASYYNRDGMSTNITMTCQFTDLGNCTLPYTPTID